MISSLMGTTFNMTFEGADARFWKEMAESFPEEVRRAMRHAGYMAMMRLKIEMLQKRPGGRQIKDISELQKWRVLDEYKRREFIRRGGKVVARRNGKYTFDELKTKGKGLAYGMNGSNWPIGGKLAQIIKYRVSKHHLTMHIGWLDKKSSRIGIMWEKGQQTKVTNRIRRMFAAIGRPLRPSKTVIVQPPRPVMKYYYEGRREWIMETLAMRFHRNVKRKMQNILSRRIRRIVNVVG